MAERQLRSSNNQLRRNLHRNQYQMDRRKFMLRVYLLAILFIIVSFVQWVPIMFVIEAQEFFANYQFIAIICLFIALSVVTALIFWERLRLTSPLNFLLAFLLMECVTIGLMRALVVSEVIHFVGSIALAVSACCIAITVGVYIRHDLTFRVVILFVCTIILFIAAVFFSILALLTDLHFSIVIYAVFLIVIVLMFLMYHAQTIHGGRYAEMRLRDFLLAAIILYHDFIILFILTLLAVKALFDKNSLNAHGRACVNCGRNGTGTRRFSTKDLYNEDNYLL